MESLMNYTSQEFGTIRTLDREGEPWFVGKDVAVALGYKEPTKAVREKVDPEDRGVSKTDTPSGAQEMVIINESGLYSLVMGSKLPTAKKFKHWVTSEVLPSIRKTGGYSVPKTNTELIATALIAAHEELEKVKVEQMQLLAENNSLKPDAEYARAVCIGDNCLTASTIAKQYGMSAEKFNELLHRMKIQWKTSDKQWVVYAKYQDKGYTKNRKSKPITHNSGKVTTPNTTVWTEKGQRFLYEQLKAVGVTPNEESE